MSDFGFKRVSEIPAEVAIVVDATAETAIPAEQVTPAVTEQEAVIPGNVSTETALGNIETITEPAVPVIPVIIPEQAATVPVVEKEIIDPFKDLGDKEKQIFEALKGKDFKTIKEYLDVATADYDAMSDLDSVREQLRLTKPKWTPEMINMELQEKYGFGVAEEDLTDGELLKFKKNLLDDSDSARDLLKSKQTALAFPSVETTPAVPAVTEQAPQYTEDQLAEFKAVWEGQVKEGVKGLTDENINVEVENEGSKEAFDFPVTISASDKNSLETLVRDFDIQKDFTEKYVKDGKINVAAFAKDKFMADNAVKFIKSAFTQGFTKGKLAQIKSDKNIDLTPTATGGTTDMTSNTTQAVKSFFSNWKNKG